MAIEYRTPRRPLPLAAWRSAAIVMLVSGAVGCGASGPSFQPVSGKLTIDGKPPANVQVSLYPVGTNGPIASGSVDSASGSFTLTSSGGVGKAPGKGAIAGKYKVVLNSSGGPAGSNEEMMKQYGGGGKAPAAPKPTFPAEYGSASTSPKEVEVKSGPNTLDLAL